MADETPRTDPAEPDEELDVQEHERALPELPSVASILTSFPDADWERRSYASSDVVYYAIEISPESWVDFAKAARDGGFDLFIDLAAVDHFTEAPRFEVALNVISMADAARIVVSTRLPYDRPVLPTVTGIFIGANFYEREAYDLFGITFEGHPDLTRILMPDDWVGHPLRKDYDIGAIPVEFKAGSVDL